MIIIWNRHFVIECTIYEQQKYLTPLTAHVCYKTLHFAYYTKALEANSTKIQCKKKKNHGRILNTFQSFTTLNVCVSLNI